MVKMKIFSDGTDLEGVEETQDILYIRFLRQNMRVIDSWPKPPNESNKYRYYVCGLEFACLIAGFIFLRDHVGKLSYFELGHTYITVFMNTTAFVRSLMVLGKKYNTMVFYFFNEIHLLHHRKKSDYAYKTHILVHKICHFYTIYVLVMMYNGISLFNLLPLYNSFTAGMFRRDGNVPVNSTFDHSVYYALPFDYTTNFRGYLGVATFNWYISVICSCYFCVVDLTILLMVFHLWGHMRLLSYNLENFPKPKSLLDDSNDSEEDHGYSEQESKEVFSRLREYIRHHNLIIDFSSRMSETFGQVLMLYYLFHQVTLCLLLLECSQMDTRTLARYGPLTGISFQELIQMSVIFELLGSSNDRLQDSIYLLPWEYMETKHRKLVFLMLKQSQRSMNLKAGSMITVGVQTMIAILKTSFSYFIMLRTVEEE